jgi:hypothetical protein
VSAPRTPSLATYRGQQPYGARTRGQLDAGSQWENSLSVCMARQPPFYFIQVLGTPPSRIAVRQPHLNPVNGQLLQSKCSSLGPSRHAAWAVRPGRVSNATEGVPLCPGRECGWLENLDQRVHSLAPHTHTTLARSIPWEIFLERVCGQSSPKPPNPFYTYPFQPVTRRAAATN